MKECHFKRTKKSKEYQIKAFTWERPENSLAVKRIDCEAENSLEILCMQIVYDFTTDFARQ